MDTIKEMLAKYGRPLIAKYLTRALLYGGGAVAAKLSIDAPKDDTVTEVAGWAAAGVCAILALLIDRWHAKTDLAQQPPK